VQPAAEPAPLPPRLVLYDGVCGLCSRAVRFLVARDRHRALRYAPLQGETAARLRAQHPAIPQTLESVVLVEDGRVYLRSKALLRTARHLTAPWRWAWHLRWLPAPLLDLGYRLVARVRYRVWGRTDACTLPAPDQRALFLD
jgi:predicted DCC family thiol-disulfide oxidoreductase YuxK